MIGSSGSLLLKTEAQTEFSAKAKEFLEKIKGEKEEMQIEVIKRIKQQLQNTAEEAPILGATSIDFSKFLA